MMAISDETISDNRGKLKLVSDDIDAYKSYIQTMHSDIEQYVNKKLDLFQASTPQLSATLGSHRDGVDD